MNNNWSTPQDLFDLLDKEFGFTLDACASNWNRKCDFYYYKEQNTLTYNWPMGSVVWMNPPYGREINDFIRHAYQQSQERKCTVVCLVPANTETAWFQDCCLNGELRFVRGRIHFTDKNGKSGRPRFASAVIIFRPNNQGAGTVSTLIGYRGGK